MTVEPPVTYGIEPPPDVLYHYTRYANLIDILKSNAIWATDIRYLNDSNEYRDAITRMHDMVEAYLALGPVHENDGDGQKWNNVQAFCHKILHKLKNPSAWVTWNVYTVSFSTHQDDLSQWRAYSRPAGVALGFDTGTLQALAQVHGYRLHRCIYDEAEKVEILEISLKKYFEILWNTDTEGAQESEELVQRTFYEFSQEFEWLAATFKDDAFIQEAEWRLISHRYAKRGSLTFHSSGSTIIPHHPFSFEAKIKDRIRRIKFPVVVLGPTNQRDLNSFSIFTLFQEFHGRSPELKHSRAPYRDI